MLSALKTHWFGALLLAVVCGVLIPAYINTIPTTTIDISLHYSLVARLSENWQLPRNDDPSLEEMNTYPRYAHRLGALVGKVVGSSFAGMQVVALLSLALVWAAIAALFLTLPRRALWAVSGVFLCLLVLNHFLIHLELFGTEFIGNYFYPQIVAQGMVMVLVAIALWLEWSAISPAITYVILGLSVPFLQQVHLLPAVEMMGTFTLLVVLNGLDTKSKNRRNMFLFGLFCILASLLLTLGSSAFGTMVVNAGNGLLRLRYTPDLASLAVECLIVIGLSAFLVWQWLRLEEDQARSNALPLKYVALFGAAAAALCLVQILAFKVGYGSEYAAQKFVLGINTALVLEVCLLLFVLVRPLRALMLVPPASAPVLWSVLVRQAIPAVFVVVGFLTVLPAPSTDIITVNDIVSKEELVKSYTASSPASVPPKYDYAIGLFPGHRIFDYLISTVVLRAPRANNADDLLNGLPLSKPKKISRIFTLEGTQPWDIPDCRQAMLKQGLVVLDGACVLEKLNEAGIKVSAWGSAVPGSMSGE